MVVVDDLGEVRGLTAERGGGVVEWGGGRDGDGFFEDPHLDGRLEEGAVEGGVFGDDLGDGGAPRGSVSRWCCSIDRAILD